MTNNKTPKDLGTLTIIIQDNGGFRYNMDDGLDVIPMIATLELLKTLLIRNVYFPVEKIDEAPPTA